ncbi:molybdopterin-dependent oxidoreductase [Actinomycetospora cinnamomea]|uniref:DMSO/TMAO reductase YedYZ molybdopterin-dependent catalytic subunit n=1 Tax=Actinomycetospora cinnamomea TaxID=663609 RepID=A0A2U1FBY2_9PSEU|nr:molybdopterin-dependent oxidoreductase [Actinomycetospora cinnamomea]PVZ09490.1 DMSO/TMAO reductase YedYZ molybdopterin-dependent catalytic subunit [Actinomycetospora cinnamomea]
MDTTRGAARTGARAEGEERPGQGGRDGLRLPPGQRPVTGFPRFGAHLHHPPPPIPEDHAIEVGGAVTASFAVPLAELARLPRRELTADFHCVAGWSALDLRWEGVAFATFYREVIEPAVDPSARVTHLVFEGLDGYRSLATIEDAMGDDVLIAENLDGRPLDGDHGAPARLVSPRQYGYVCTKHLHRIEVRTSAPTDRPRSLPDRLLEEHPRARVWEEERHGSLPGRLVRPIYRVLTPPIRVLCARGAVAGEPPTPNRPPASPER